MAKGNNSPLLGYNTNVKHSGHVFHIQTEDSGLEHPHIITHLFTSGTILATKKTSYAEVAKETDWEERVRQLMKDQHKSMFVELRDGQHDAIATRILGIAIGGSVPAGAPTEAAAPPSEKPAAAAETSAPEDPGHVRIIVPAAMRSSMAPKAKPEGETPSRAPSIFETPDAAGSFGESLISDKSLDEVILTYLKDELDE
jgi:hypothetical protein